ncbi:hypothetical protein F5144DRAFT_523524 [Chaetomium tenue]|uniref:Uncharacterized protein n=1 Tax=Chaetomium tenue TaxID=1854479 RepID=A0ACB7PMA7_9PEZI|nr:hypothetical protein F5144DRAFT_523524 [Chaetomium globosum]
MNTVFYPPHLGFKAGGQNATPSPTWCYFIDASCDDASKGDLEACLFEARHWAKRAYERLTSQTDTDFARVFQILFKAPITDTSRYPMSPLWEYAHRHQHPKDLWTTAAEHVLGVLHNFAHCWRRTYNRQAADVRIYATDLAHTRWVACGPFCVDPVNGVYAEGLLHELLVPNTAATSCGGHVFPVEGENQRRSVMDISPDLWKPATGSTGFLTLRGLHDPWKLAEDLIPCTLFHEFMHVYLLDDFIEDERGCTASWGYCMRRKRSEAPVCAESLAMLGLWVALADMRPANRLSGGFSLPRGWREAPGTLYDGDGRATAEDDTTCLPEEEGVLSAIRGEVMFYEDLTS